MQIRTPKKYRGVQRRSIISCRRLLFYAVTLALIGIGIGIYQNRVVFAPIVQDALQDVIAELEGQAATLTAPEPTPTFNPTNKLVEANNYWLQGALNQAMDTYIDILDAVPNEPEIFYRIALSLISLGRAEEALVYAEQAINAAPYSADAWAIRAWALDWNFRAGEALSSALHALELEPENSRAKAYLAEAYFTLGQVSRAEALIEDALEDDPNSAEAYRARGLIRREQHYDLSGALEDFEAALDIAEHINISAIDIAITETIAGNYDAALEILEQVIETNPRNRRALFRLGQIYNLLGDPEAALPYLQDCADFNPDSIDCAYLLGRVQYRLGLFQDAADSFEAAIELGSESAQHYYWAGWSQINLGNCTRAVIYLEPGYRLAQEANSASLIEAFETVIPQCPTSLDFFSPATATPAP